MHTGTAVVLEVLNLASHQLQFLRSVKSDVCTSCFQQLLNIFLIDIAPLTLTVGTIVAAKGYALVELDAQPAESLNDISLGSRHETGGIGVLDTEHQITAMLACKQIIVQGGTHTADMKRTRRTGCKADPYSSFCHISLSGCIFD